MPTTIKQLIPRAGRQRLRSVLNTLADRLQPELPPHHLRNHISPLWLDFAGSGRDQLEFCVELAGLSPTDRVLDIGCGVGRFALPLSAFLSSSGSYEGFDVFEPGIAWCTENITSKRPAFKFTVADVESPWSSGAYTSATFRFPYPPGTFDFAYAGSLFTHLVESGARNYLNEVAVALKPGGRFVCTWLLFNSEGARLVEGRSMGSIWGDDHGTHRTISDTTPEASVLYDELSVRSWYEEAGLRIVEPVRLDATYCPARIPKERRKGMHLYYASSIIAIRPPGRA